MTRNADSVCWFAPNVPCATMKEPTCTEDGETDVPPGAAYSVLPEVVTVYMVRSGLDTVIVAPFTDVTRPMTCGTWRAMSDP